MQSGKDYGTDYCDNIFGLPKAQVNPGTLALNRGSRRLLQETLDPANISLQMVNISVLSLNTTSSVTVLVIQDEDPYLCPSGQFKENTNRSLCNECPRGASTIFPFTGAWSRDHCKCMDGFYKKPTSNPLETNSFFNFTCEPCEFNFYRSYSDLSFDNDTYCKPCPPNMFTPTPTSSSCYCKDGFYYNQNTSECVSCPSGFYCADGIQYACPAYSSSPPGSSRRKQCICENATHFGNLELEDAQCVSLKPGILCPIASVQCRCAPGWILKISLEDPSLTRCETPCKQGQYAVFNDTDKSVSECKNCARGKYSSQLQALSEDTCISCPPLKSTKSSGSVNISDCTCSDTSLLPGEDCSTCKSGFYYDDATNACVMCPGGLSSFQGSRGIDSCFLCPLGQRTVPMPTSSRKNDPPFRCEPCPLGFFSMNIGTKCTVCPKGYTTLNVGSTSSLSCVLANYFGALS